MTDKLKDEMPEIRLIERHGNVEYSYRTNEFITKNEHWIVNGKRFDHAPTSREVEAAYADLSPPVPDDVAEAVDYFTNGMSGLKFDDGLKKVGRDRHFLETLICAASKPPVDTIAVPREVLQGVREALDAQRQADREHEVEGASAYWCILADKAHKLRKGILASLDAVLAEGE